MRFFWGGQLLGWGGFRVEGFGEFLGCGVVDERYSAFLTRALLRLVEGRHLRRPAGVCRVAGCRSSCGGRPPARLASTKLALRLVTGFVGDPGESGDPRKLERVSQCPAR